MTTAGGGGRAVTKDKLTRLQFLTNHLPRARRNLHRLREKALRLPGGIREARSSGGYGSSYAERITDDLAEGGQPFRAD